MKAEERKTYINMNFYKNQAIINNIVDFCVEDGEIDYFFVATLKELFIVSEYIEEFKVEKEEDGTTDIKESFEKIRNNGDYKMFVSLYNRRDLIEFEELLDKSLNQKARLQLEEIRREKSIENIMEDFLFGLLAKIPDEKGMAKMLKEIPKMLKGLDKDKIEEIKKITENLNGISK